MFDFEEIFKVIPKKVSTWSTQDVAIWMQINSMTYQTSKLTQNHIDGEKLLKLDPVKMSTEIGMESIFVMKRLMEWIQSDHYQFDEYVQDTLKQNKENNKPIVENTEEVKVKKWFQQEQNSKCFKQLKKDLQQKNILIKKNKKKNQDNLVSYPSQMESQPMKPISHKYAAPIFKVQQQSSEDTHNYGKFAHSQYIIPVKIEAHINGEVYKLCNDKISVGRIPNSDILINEDSVSRNHAEIIKIKQNFYFRDVGSKYGSYIKLKANEEVKEGYTLVISTNQILIKSLKIKKTKDSNDKTFKEVFDMKLLILGQQSKQTHHVNKTSLKISKKNLEIGLNDSCVDNIQGAFILSDGKVCMQSLNGQIYRKISVQEKIKIHSDLQLKLGASSIITFKSQK